MEALTATGPALGPLVGGFLSDAAGWRWLYWIQLILAGVAWLLIASVPETYAPILLSRRAATLRKERHSDIYTTEKELDTRPLGERLRIFLLRPFQLLFLEPILFFLSLYMSVLYGLLYDLPLKSKTRLLMVLAGICFSSPFP